MIRFDIFNQTSGVAQFTAEIDCEEGALRSTKLGLAVKWAIANEANLSGANLIEADLSGTDLSGANLSRANLSGADLSGANLRLIGGRTDGYYFYLIREDVPTNRVMICAGCRYFTLDEARAHWTETRGGTELGEESLALVDHAERMAKIVGWL